MTQHPDKQLRIRNPFPFDLLPGQHPAVGPKLDRRIRQRTPARTTKGSPPSRFPPPTSPVPSTKKAACPNRCGCMFDRATSSPSMSPPVLLILTRTGTHSPFITPSYPGKLPVGSARATPRHPRKAQKKDEHITSPFQRRVLARLSNLRLPVTTFDFLHPPAPFLDAELFPPQKLHGQIEQFLYRQIPSFSVQQTDQVSDRIRLPFGIGIPVDLPLFPSRGGKLPTPGDRSSTVPSGPWYRPIPLHLIPP